MKVNNAILAILNRYVASELIASVVYNSPTKVNVELDATAHPCAVLFIFRDGAINVDGGTFSEIAEVNVMFLTQQPNLDFNALHNDELMDEMVNVATCFVSDVMAADIGDIIGDEIKMLGLYNYDDKNTTGVSLQFRIRSFPQCL